MDQLQSIWAAARENIVLNDGLSFHAWIDVIDPLALHQNTSFRNFSTGYSKDVEDFYFESLFNAVKAANDTISDVKIVLARTEIYNNT
jgi:hypothetical protein